MSVIVTLFLSLCYTAGVVGLFLLFINLCCPMEPEREGYGVYQMRYMPMNESYTDL